MRASSSSAWGTSATEARSSAANPISAGIRTISSPSSAHRVDSRDPAGTRMFREAAEAGGTVRAQLERNRGAAEDLGRALRELRPRAVVTCARGSSDHAATYAKYLVETRRGIL